MERKKTDDMVRKYPQGIKWTRQRKDVYEVLLQAAEPLSAVQIYDRVKTTQESGNYAISTIYRILAAFEELDIIIKTNWMGEGTVVYELNRGGHTHYAVCLSCHKRVPLQSCPFAHMHLPDKGEMPEDFIVTDHKLELYGYCKNCKINYKTNP